MTTVGMGVASAAPPAMLTVHYAGPGTGNVAGLALTGSASVTDTGTDSFGERVEVTYSEASDTSALGFRVGGDSAFAEHLRYVWADGGQAEIWVIDADPRVYDEPLQVPEEYLRVEGRSAYVEVSALEDLLGITASTGRNGYQFDGYASGTLDILTLVRGRDYHEIAMDIDRFASNATTQMLNNYANLIFQDVDGIRDGQEYYLSLASVERLLQVGTHINDEGTYLLEPVEVAHDALGQADPAQVGFSAQGLADLDRFANQQINAGWPGLAVVVTKDGQTVLEQAWGDALVYSTGMDSDGEITEAQLLPPDQRIPATTETLWDLASNSKMYATNYAIQKLVSDGLLDLDATLASFEGWEEFTDDNSEYTGKWTIGGEGGITEEYTGKATITIRDLLNHRAGLIPDPEYPNLDSAGDLWYQTDDPSDRTGIIDAISRSPLRHAPRTTFAYSDVDYMILGLIVEQVSGQRLDMYLEENFYGPLGLTDTVFNPLEHGVAPERVAATELNGNTRDGNVSFGELPDGEPVPMREYTLQGEVHDEKAWYSMAGIGGHAGLFSTTSDMAVLTQVMLNRGLYGGQEFFSPEVVDQFLTPADTASYGLGWRMHTAGGQGYYYFNWGPSRYTYGHQGWTGTLTVIDPVHQMTITILTNMRHAPVVSPPNGFDTASLPLANLVPISAYVYRALSGVGHDYTIAASLSPVDGVEVPFGTSATDVLGALPGSVTLTDTDGAEYDVAVEWELEDYSGDTPGEVTAVGTVTLPATVLQNEQDPVSLEVRTTVTVLQQEPGEPEPTPTEDPTEEPAPEPSDPVEEPHDGEEPSAPGVDGTDPEAALPGDRLPDSGAGVLWLVALATLSLLAGAGMLMARRRRLQ